MLELFGVGGIAVSVSKALSFATQAKSRANDPQEAARFFELSIQELCKEIRKLENRVIALENESRR
jgi:hypothetical protein